MVKHNPPLQIRLTEDVIFLRGPSTGLDFRGRPQVIQDGQPAMVRGLLTLRLTKPTRIRRIDISLIGKAKTEWPEGIGPRRLDTNEENEVISDTTTFFSARRQSGSRSRSTRRAASLGPGVSLARYDEDDEELDDDDDVAGVPADGEDLAEWVDVSRGRSHIPRSASALPGTHDGHTWHRDGFSRRPSFDHDREEMVSPTDESAPALEALSLRDRGPSPAYTPTATPLPPSNQPYSAGRSSLRQTSGPPGLSPIFSQPVSRAPSDRDDSTSTERRFPSRSAHDSFSGAALVEGLEEAFERSPSPATRGQDAPQRPSILESAGHRSGSGEVRFASSLSHELGREPDIIEILGPPASRPPPVDPPQSRTQRAASIRSTMSTASASTGTLSHSSQDHSSAPQSDVPSGNDAVHSSDDARSEQRPAHPAQDTIQSAVPTRANSPVPSLRNSLPPAAPRASTSSQSDQASIASPPASRPGSILSGVSHQRRHLSLGSSAASSPNTSGELQEIRQGRRNRIGSASTIVINHNASTPPVVPPPSNIASTQSSLYHSSRHNSDTSNDDRDRGRVSHKFSLANALRSMSRSNKSKSRTRSRDTSLSSQTAAAPSMSRNGSGTSTALGPQSFLPPHLADRSRRSSSASRTRDSPSGSTADFVPPFGRGGAGRSRSRERTVSPMPGGKGKERSESTARGRSKGMKALTGALGLGGDDEAEREEEGLHNWKEFRKGTYNYPISFSIPSTTPPTIHAEFGSVTYHLKATVVRVGALTPNLTTDVEVWMIAGPQEDDLEETENVLVERQWEEQMRYQIALSGKAFPIGGTLPISIRLMPLMKCKIHRLTVALEEKTDYYAQERKVARHEQPKKYNMLFIKHPGPSEREPLLPIMSDAPDAARTSPLAPLAAAAFLNNPQPDHFLLSSPDEVDDDSMYASLLDPLGPWHLEKDLKVPECSTGIRFTTKHAKTNISVGHWLKVTIRVERGDDVAVDAKGRRKQFDIIIETPIKILDCRVNPLWNSLPSYTTSAPSLSRVNHHCSVHSSKHSAPLQPAAQHHSSRLAAASSVVHNREPSTSGLGHGRDRDREREREREREEGEDTLLERNIVYDRLMSGQETEEGETPPSYVEAVASGSGSLSLNGTEGRAGSSREGSRSASRGRPGRRGLSVEGWGNGDRGAEERGRSGSRLRSEMS